MKKFTSSQWVMALFIAAISLCTVLPGLHVRASEFSPNLGEPYVEEGTGVSFAQQPDSVQYVPINGDDGHVRLWFQLNGYQEGMAIRIQLTDPTNPNQVKLGKDYGEQILPLGLDEQGGCTFTTEMIYSMGAIDAVFSCSQDCQFAYSVQVYADETCSNLLAETTRTIIFFYREIKFSREPQTKSYGSIYEHQGKNYGESYASFDIRDMPSSDLKVRVQLTDPQNQNGTWFTTMNNETLSVSEGGCWVPAAVWGPQEDSTYMYSIDFSICSPNEAEVGYTVSIYASEDTTAAPLITSEEKTVVFIHNDNYPRVGSLPRWSGELNTEIPLSFSIQPKYLLGKPAKIRMYFHLSTGSYEDLEIKGEGWTEAIDQYQTYEYSTSNLQTSQFTLSLLAKAAVTANYSVQLADGDGNYIGFTSGDGIIQIPLNLSETDKQALIALRDSNELSNDLHNFIEKGIYLKDMENGNSSENVGVTWNTESPARVQRFFINDRQSRAVTSLNLNPLTGLKNVEINGTNLKQLDLSDLKLRELYLWDTKLKWGDVKLPTKWDEGWHSLSGYTQIQIGTPLDYYNSVAANGTEIDLSEYAVINGVPSTFTWYKENTTTNRYEISPMDSTGAGKFILSGKPGEKFYCSIQNENYENWRMETSYVKISRNSDDYDKQDIEGLKKLAADNPQVSVLQEFIANEGWMAENWDSWQDQIRTQWDSDNRLSHLLIQLDWNSKDTISTLDLSAFTELKYFECDRWLNIKELDLANNTKLEHLHLFSNKLQRIDASMCTNLQIFMFATQSRKEGPYAYDECSLNSLSLPSSLKLLRIEHAHLGRFDFGQFPNLVALHIGNCQALQPLNLDKLTRLETVELPLTTQFGDWIKTLPTTVNALWIQETDYAMPDATLLGRLKQFGVPKGITQLDLSQMPNLEVIGWEGNDIRYSTVKNWRKELEIAVVYRMSLNSSSWWGVGTNIQLQSPSHPNQPWHFENGDTIDISSEAVINGVKSKYLWVNGKYNTEETEALQEVPGRPGVFVLNSQEADYGEYYCLIMNEQFCEITPINYSSGWRMETSWIRVNTQVPVTFHEGDVQALANLVNNANNPELNEWWSSGAWKTEDYVNNAQTMWNNENPRRLTGLWINTSVGTSADLSAFDKLEQLNLSYYNRELTEVKLPTETQNLRGLMLESNQALTSLIVAPYSNLTHLNVNGTGLAACDVSQNKQLTELFMQWTKIQSVEETAPEIAQQLTVYGASNAVVSIDLNNFPALKQFYPSVNMRYSAVKNPRQMDPLDDKYYTNITKGNTYRWDYTAIGTTFDVTEFAAEDHAAADPVWIVMDPYTYKDSIQAVQGTSFLLNDEILPESCIIAQVTNDLFPGWILRYNTWAYTTDGDVNLDRKVNVQDVTGLVSYMLGSWPEEQLYGWVESNTNHDSKYSDAADLVGIVNIILNEPITKGEALRAAYVPQVEMSLDAQNMLHIDAESPIAALYMEFAGATQELPLLNQAARLIQSCSLKDDTLRVVAYSLDGKTIGKGEHALMQMLPGMQLVKASFSDAHAVPMELKGDYMPTANEVIAPISETKAIYNYPNPAKGSTTFCYSLDETAQRVEIQVIAANGAMVGLLQGLPAEQGHHEETVDLPFASGVYYYRLVVNGKQVKATNTLIIK